MNKPKDMMLADAMAEAIRQHRNNIKLKRALAISVTVNIMLVIALFATTL